MGASEPFGVYIGRLRRAKKLTLKEVADQLKVTIPYLSDVERGKRKPFPVKNGDRYETLAELLGESVRSLKARAVVDRNIDEFDDMPAAREALQLFRQADETDLEGMVAAMKEFLAKKTKRE